MSFVDLENIRVSYDGKNNILKEKNLILVCIKGSPKI